MARLQNPIGDPQSKLEESSYYHTVTCHSVAIWVIPLVADVSETNQLFHPVAVEPY